MNGSRRHVVVALVALLFIGVTVDADHTAASFTATTDNPGNQFVTAHLARHVAEREPADVTRIGIAQHGAAQALEDVASDRDGLGIHQASLHAPMPP